VRGGEAVLVRGLVAKYSIEVGVNVDGADSTPAYRNDSKKGVIADRICF
jgi:hypothetical protein